MESVLTKEIIFSKTWNRIIAVGVFIILTTLGAFVRIPLPFTPVPLTLQTFFVLLSGAFLGARIGCIPQCLYIFLGMSGLPVFSGAGSGVLYLLGPTGGYLVGFVLASFFIGKFISARSNSFAGIFLLFCAADLILLGCGIIWLRLLSGYPLKTILIMGFLPFVPGDLLKITGATLIYLKTRKRIQEIF